MEKNAVSSRWYEHYQMAIIKEGKYWIHLYYSDCNIIGEVNPNIKSMSKNVGAED